MLITSRQSRRWVIPKGNPIRGLAPHEAAAHEALEEAGIIGAADPGAIGEYRYVKRRKDGTTREVTVTVFPLAFTEQLDDWLEQDERDTRWFDLAEAAGAVDEPELQRLLAGFSASIGSAGTVGAPVSAIRTRPGRERRLAIGRWRGFAWAVTLLAAVLIGALFYALAGLAR